ncbi:MAG: hypothetical protein ACXACA_05975 [Candidatus Ranarchaeia archaeon]
MIKIKILNPAKGRNEPTFRPLFFVHQLLLDYSIQITDRDDYDYLFIGMADFIDKKLPLQESVDKALEFLDIIEGDYFLFDGSDSHSLMGAYEVFTQSKAKLLFKNQLHKDKSLYKTPKAFGKWYFGDQSGLELSYDIPDDVWSRIKLSGWNMMSNVPDHKNYIQPSSNKSIDVCAIFGRGSSEAGYDHQIRNDHIYTEHRKNIWDVLDKLSNRYEVKSGRMEWQQYMQCLHQSKICISPFGMGEIRQGDGEAVQVGTAICKEDMSMFNTGPVVWREHETYIPFDYDCSNLADQLTDFLENFEENNEIVNNMRRTYLEEYSPENLCMRWYNIFSNLESVVNED